MRVLGLISGGKDSVFNLMQCVASGHEIVALANLYPSNKSELNSHMFQSAGFEAVELIGQALDLPLFRAEIKGTSKVKCMQYEATEGDEIEDLFDLLKMVKSKIQIDAVASGAVLSDYQRIRVENVCTRLQLVSVSYLWQRNQAELLKEMIQCEMEAVVVRVAAMGLDPGKHLGKSIRFLEPHLLSMQEKYGLNVCGEGGEYETLTLDCPLYKSRIVIEESEVVLDSDDPIAPTGYLQLKKLKLETKLPVLDLSARLANLPLKNSMDFVINCLQTEEPLDSLMGGDAKGDELTTGNLNITQAEHFSTSGDGWLFIGGIIGLSEDQNEHEAFTKAMDKLKCALQANGHNLQDLCSINLYVADMTKYAELNKIYCQILKHSNPPARACVQVPLPASCPAIIEAISWSPGKVVHDNGFERSTMHVQSISHWCPANIGPYSQAVKVGDWIHLAGQISLVPGNMQMPSDNITAQCQLSLRHVERLLKAAESNCGLRDVVQAICYVSNQKYIEYARKTWEERSNNAIVDYLVVSGLPRNALVEWQVWAHTHNNQFEYEETGQCIQDWSISVFRRWNLENNVAAIVCNVENHVQNSEVILSAPIFRETIEYVIEKLNQGHEVDTNSVCSLKVFYAVRKSLCVYSFVSILEEFRRTIPLVHTIVPVLALNTKNTFLSITGLRTQ